MAEVMILGSAQDGGVPHAGCLCENCRLARQVFLRRRLPASIGVVAGDEWAIIDATKAFEEQVHALWTRLPGRAEYSQERYQAPRTVLLTHAHTGHYVGLWELDRSVLAAQEVRVLAPPRMAEFLAGNEPWKTMQAEGFIRIQPAPVGEWFTLLLGVEVMALEVPHRSEWPTETVCYVIRGAERSLLYLPDIDSWETWEHSIDRAIKSVDVALLDGTFWDVPTNTKVPHPPIKTTMDLLQDLILTGEAEVIFTHMNHNNPVLTPGSAEAVELERRGYRRASEGDVIEI